jgi:hypothetical protein
MRRLSFLLSLLVLATACGGDDPSGPSNANVGGIWHVTFSNMSGGGVTCNSNNSNMSLTHASGTAFSGSYGPMTLSCTNGTDTFQDTFQGTIVNGTVSVNAVTFDLDTQDFHQTGSANGNSMSGTAHWVIDLGAGQTATLNGNWSAAKQ